MERRPITILATAILVISLADIYIYYKFERSLRLRTIKPLPWQPDNSVRLNFGLRLVDLSPLQSVITHTILFYNKPTWVSIDRIGGRCPNTNCAFTTDKNYTYNSSAIVFCTTEDLTETPPISAMERPKDQVWIFFAMEPPVKGHRQWYRNPSWHNTMNWSMNYRLDADIFRPVLLLETRRVPVKRNYSEIFRGKTKLAAWTVSHCDTDSKREIYVKKMQQYGIEVDIYGTCGKNHTRIDNNIIKSRIDKQYKFYLAFENSFCKDYVTEKFFGHYDLNTIVVVRGSLDYERWIPPDTFINTAQFNTIQRLVEYMLFVGSNETLYTSYLRKKENYTWSYATNTYSFCSICEKLNNLDNNRKTYRDIESYIHDGTCHPPTDLTT